MGVQMRVGGGALQLARGTASEISCACGQVAMMQSSAGLGGVWAFDFTWDV